jgi:hemolysin III
VAAREAVGYALAVTTWAVVPRQTLGEEIASSVIHGIGVVLAIAGLAVLSASAATHGNAWHVVGCAIFGTTLVLLYVASTLYHSIPVPRVKQALRMLDHAAIYLLIAGTYTPFCLVSLRGPWGWSLLGVVWGLALVGVASRAALSKRLPAVSVAVYVLMGWAVLVAAGPLRRQLSSGGLTLLVAGGVLYTAGLAFYGWRRLPYHHAVWHAFVLGGSVLHFFAVLLYVIPARIS